MIKHFVVLLLLYLCCLNQTFAASHKDGALQFEIPIEADAAKFLGFLEYPAYLVAALEINGIKTSILSRPTLVDEQTVQFNKVTLHFAEKKGMVYLYKGSFEWVTPIKTLTFDVPVEVDTSTVSKGKIQISIFLPLTNLFPDTLVERIKFKVRTLSEPAMQGKMLNYFNDLSNKTVSGSKLQDIFPLIMLQAYNAPSNVVTCPPHEPGDAESLSDQAYLLITLAIWLIIAPVAIASYLYWRKRKNAK
jgi:hypothetical protein